MLRPVARTSVALLRGINVGGRNRIAMAELRACFQAAGYGDVRTYIQSGNVVFGADREDRARLTTAIETMLASAFGYAATVELRDRVQMQAVVDGAPAGFGQEPDRYRYDVLFLLPPSTPGEALVALRPRDGVDAVAPGPGVVYASRLIARASQSGLSRLASDPIYQRLTVRNWNTTTRLLAMMDHDRAPDDG
jgi:uncharacterized protein (DUF1697 family)